MLLGRGESVAGWFNTNAKRVTDARVDRFKETLPGARVYACSTFDEAKHHADELAKNPPAVLFCGGGDGTIVTLLNFLRERGVTKFPVIGLFKLGTGNGWPSAVGARRYERTLPLLPKLVAGEIPLHHYSLIEVEGRVCQFGGVGWDATLLHDYKRNLEKRENQLVAGGLASRMSKGVWGYLYSLFRHTVPGEISRLKDRTLLKLEDIGAQRAKTFDAKRHRVEAPSTTLYEGPMSIATCGVEPYWGAKFMAFPYAEAEPGRFNFRVYDRKVFTGVNNMFNLWQGRDLPGMHDYWVTGVRLHLSRPMPYQVGGDVVAPREVLDFTLAKETVELIEWSSLSS
ncbi:MAG: diacylglycerol kinase family protein [Myxococcaceae bacterium]